MKNKGIRFLLLLTVLLALLCGCSGQEAEPELPSEPPTEATEPPTEAPPQPIEATLAVCGDVMSHMPVTNDAWNGERYDYLRIMGAAEPYVSAADFAVANIETTLAGGPNYSGYPAFNSPDDLAVDLKAMGFDLLLTANNHSLDKGGKGLRRTLDVLDEVGLAHVGTSRTQEEYDSNLQMADVGGISVAFLGYTYGTNGIPVPKDAPYAVNLFNTDYLTHLSDPDEEKLLADLAAAEATGADLVAVMIHWGVEYQTSANSYQKKLADFLIDNGADLILGGHSHVPQPMELHTTEQGNTGFVCYSLGNFISSQNDPLTDTTAVLTVELIKDPVTGETTVKDYFYHPMLMLDREYGENRFELLDVHQELKREDISDSMRGKLEKAAENCTEIFGEGHDAILRLEQ